MMLRNQKKRKQLHFYSYFIHKCSYFFVITILTDAIEESDRGSNSIFSYY